MSKSLGVAVLAIISLFLISQHSYAGFPAEAVKISELTADTTRGLALSNVGWEFQGRDGKPVYISCANCHGDKGKLDEGHHHPNLAGQTRNYLIWQLVNFRNHTRKFPMMENIANRLSDQDIADLSAYYSQIKD